MSDLERDATNFYNSLWCDTWGDLQRYGPMHRHQNRILRSLTSRLAWDSVLDVGCGAGQNLNRVCRGRQSGKVVGLDISELALTFARQQLPGAKFHVLNIENELLDERFDLVLCIQVLEHIPDDDAAIKHLVAMTDNTSFVQVYPVPCMSQNV